MLMVKLVQPGRIDTLTHWAWPGTFFEGLGQRSQGRNWRVTASGQDLADIRQGTNLRDVPGATEITWTGSDAEFLVNNWCRLDNQEAPDSASTVGCSPLVVTNPNAQ